MGNWVQRTLQNEIAREWMQSLTSQQDLRAVADAFAKVPHDGAVCLQIAPAFTALAAAELVAALNGSPSQALPANIVEWLKGKPKPTPQLRQRAIEVVKTILNELENDDSEIKYLWEKSEEELLYWTASVEELRTRLTRT